MNKAIYPGSFDPITLGHLDILERLSPLYEEVTVVISHSPNKKYLLSEAERMQTVKQCVEHLPNVRVDSHYGLTVEYAKKVEAQIILRGLRAISDFEYEMSMAAMNKQLAPKIETLIAFANPIYTALSSRMVKEVARFGGSIEGLVPKKIHSVVLNRIKENKS